MSQRFWIVVIMVNMINQEMTDKNIFKKQENNHQNKSLEK